MITCFFSVSSDTPLVPQRRQLNGDTLDVSREQCCREYKLLQGTTTHSRINSHMNALAYACERKMNAFIVRLCQVQLTTCVICFNVTLSRACVHRASSAHCAQHLLQRDREHNSWTYTLLRLGNLPFSFDGGEH